MDKPTIKWMGSPNFSSPRGYKIIAIVNHIMEGTLAGTDAWFANPASKVSSHFGVGKNGEIHQYVDLKNHAWANGAVNKPDWPLLIPGANPNYYTISIEHEGQSGDVMPEVQYQATLALHRWLIETMGIPVTRDTIIGHYRIDSVNKSRCPGNGFPLDRLLKDLQGGMDVLKAAVLLYTKEDFWAGYDVAVKNGNCAVFIRPADGSVPSEALSAEKLIVVGGLTTNHPNEVLLSGKDKYQTAAAVAKYLG
ncbi:N-acetylmuramoyl-L-alanine amidase [Desulfosporosinus youngiae]|uniref:N-acetylmuramoyl-L-alanine amidase n=1 Tax=Desulfosporosinus youngiae DSM 17734 TaxID=768710 RepID=H5Y3N2_9FIRM|nr:peptidoglycan recognition family protein [Desulfosporosinus youngiae]EHQ89276.1 negative regulator of beta-lactamase expression [Desulfosporosinus youngiae DSM 17734]